MQRRKKSFTWVLKRVELERVYVCFTPFLCQARGRRRMSVLNNVPSVLLSSARAHNGGITERRRKIAPFIRRERGERSAAYAHVCKEGEGRNIVRWEGS